MPEAPELEVVKGFLIERAVGANVESARVLRPSVLRSIAGDFEERYPRTRPLKTFDERASS